jgi:hypothetical protein
VRQARHVHGAGLRVGVVLVDAGLLADVLLDVLDDGRVGDLGDGDRALLFLLVGFVFAAGEAGEQLGGLVGGELLVVGCGLFGLFDFDFFHGDGGLGGGLLRFDDGLLLLGAIVLLLLSHLSGSGSLDLGFGSFEGRFQGRGLLDCRRGFGLLGCRRGSVGALALLIYGHCGIVWGMLVVG